MKTKDISEAKDPVLRGSMDAMVKAARLLKIPAKERRCQPDPEENSNS